MPWTFAHPAAILPLRRLGPLRMPLAALVMGSIAPDVGYYFGCFDWATYAHSANGLFVVCLPVALVLTLLVGRFHQFLVAPLPDPHRTALARLSPPPMWPLAHAARTAAAVLVGATTHVAWDSFTHAGGAAVQAIAPLRTQLFVLAGRSFATYNVLQHASTLLGLTVLAIAYRRWLRRVAAATAIDERDNRRRSVALSVAAALSLALGFTVAHLQTSHETAAASVVIFRGAIDSTVAFIGAYLALALHARYRDAAQLRG